MINPPEPRISKEINSRKLGALSLRTGWKIMGYTPILTFLVEQGKLF